MLIDFSALILDLTGQPCLDGSKPVTLGALAVTALTLPVPDEGPVPVEVKLRRFRLAVAAAGASGPVDLTAEDIAAIKDVIGRAFAPLAVGRAFALLDPAS